MRAPGQMLDEYLRRLPAEALSDMSNLTYTVRKDTIYLANGSVGDSFLINNMINAVAKTKLQTNIKGTGGKGIFGSRTAFLLGIRIVFPVMKADGVTPLTNADAYNLSLGAVTFSIDGKPKHAVYVPDLPQGEGLYVQNSAVTAAAAPAFTAYCNGEPRVDNRFIFDEAIRIEPDDQLELSVDYGAGIVASAALHLVSKLDAYAYVTAR